MYLFNFHSHDNYSLNELFLHFPDASFCVKNAVSNEKKE
ncbi:hypothetical protein CSC18_1467 [Klebsiella aerogenes]|nr:hypothetical protein CSC18_1467 [Klebsiella aerogenes]